MPWFDTSGSTPMAAHMRWNCARNCGLCRISCLRGTMHNQVVRATHAADRLQACQSGPARHCVLADTASQIKDLCLMAKLLEAGLEQRKLRFHVLQLHCLHMLAQVLEMVLHAHAAV